MTVDATLDFQVGASGAATQVTLRQNGMDQTGHRLDPQEAKRIADQAAAAQRFKDQKPATGSEDALRSNIEALRAGQPLYDKMSPGLANVTRQQLRSSATRSPSSARSNPSPLKASDQAAADIYERKFENGVTEWRIIMAADGKVESVGFRSM